MVFLIFAFKYYSHHKVYYSLCYTIGMVGFASSELNEISVLFFVFVFCLTCTENLIPIICNKAYCCPPFMHALAQYVQMESVSLTFSFKLLPMNRQYNTLLFLIFQGLGVPIAADDPRQRNIVGQAMCLLPWQQCRDWRAPWKSKLSTIQFVGFLHVFICFHLFMD